jgi:hypothetical protein
MSKRANRHVMPMSSYFITNLFRCLQGTFAVSRLKLAWLTLSLYFLALGALKAQQCPTITNTDLTSVSICSGQLVSKLQVNTSATAPAYRIEFVRFDTIQTNPYLGKNGVHLSELQPSEGKATATNVELPANTSATNKTYYIYACLKPEPDISVCSPFALITVTVIPQLPKCLPVVIRKTKSSRLTRR